MRRRCSPILPLRYLKILNAPAWGVLVEKILFATKDTVFPELAKLLRA
jgi:hypothetical protein